MSKEIEDLDRRIAELTRPGQTRRQAVMAVLLVAIRESIQEKEREEEGL